MEQLLTIYIQQKESGNETYTASKGWFARLKQHSQIHGIKISGEAVSADTEATRAFTVKFKKIIEDNEELHALAQQLTEQQKEEEDEDRCTKEMQTKDLTDILSTIHTAAEKLCDIIPDRERSSRVKKRHKSQATLYYEIPQEMKKNQNI
jgi:hypothetical protein